MKVIIAAALLLLSSFLMAQQIGQFAPDKAPISFPSNSWGADIMFGEGGFGLGTFYKRAITKEITGFVDLSISETKDDREIEYYDPYYGTSYSPFKVNRSLLMPLNFGAQIRLFDEVLSENLRPYVMAGVGPTFVITTPYEEEFFSSFKHAKMHYAAGGYVGFGAYFGESTSNLIGINVRYYYTHLFGGGIENLVGQFRNNFGHFYLSLNVGVMY
ncbi:MAG: hypothetical protein A2499_01775 [Stygiobacter sp. RIFOXYC12_FULL_38_8]|nr:MAG: hypothetical protein A2X62_01425 [Stygiobacter sp. GWC2_38_9]OGU85685.1 MAG: hypothetical protein A2279_06785 [Stygiobacter sp. RIFOXYA12_FULL_38_9]OGV09792.1 MAG: hypothetical protein A2299_14765 [Stygiobacter sp. RIFOXYB2_FULL_37_11]OGV13662.1 MAG: hypothetical protein A2440_10885 [Stygiobacter sp. RIFOXYC2_FULL_38_25]OGV17102.1 MAG: hypothetical protein A2237_12365 [Stygiobacter sp. RIFOXYA2_FULL_38_8]OGV24830.1 MAG: hypothetical protein A2499_01775 [Stygiobacter sp. RIFOXYC12_FULL_